MRVNGRHRVGKGQRKGNGKSEVPAGRVVRNAFFRYGLASAAGAGVGAFAGWKFADNHIKQANVRLKAEIDAHSARVLSDEYSSHAVVLFESLKEFYDSHRIPFESPFLDVSKPYCISDLVWSYGDRVPELGDDLYVFVTSQTIVDVIVSSGSEGKSVQQQLVEQVEKFLEGNAFYATAEEFRNNAFDYPVDGAKMGSGFFLLAAVLVHLSLFAKRKVSALRFERRQKQIEEQERKERAEFLRKQERERERRRLERAEALREARTPASSVVKPPVAKGPKRENGREAVEPTVNAHVQRVERVLKDLHGLLEQLYGVEKARAVCKLLPEFISISYIARIVDDPKQLVRLARRKPELRARLEAIGVDLDVLKQRLGYKNGERVEEEVEAQTGSSTAWEELRALKSDLRGMTRRELRGILASYGFSFDDSTASSHRDVYYGDVKVPCNAPPDENELMSFGWGKKLLEACAKVLEEANKRL